VSKFRPGSLSASLVVFAAGPAAAVSLVPLQRAHLIAHTSLWVLAALLFACSASNAVVIALEPRLPLRAAVHARTAMAALSTAWFVYATGLGSLLVVAYAIGIADAMRVHGSRAWRPGLLWATVGIALGEIFIQVGLAPSVVNLALAHCLAIATYGCLAILARTLGESTAATERARAKVEEGREYFHDLVQHAADVIALVTDRLCIGYVSPGIAELAGRAADSCIGQHINEVFGDHAGEDIARAYESLTLSDYLSCEWLLTNDLGENRRVLARLTRRRDGSLVLNLRDVTTQRALEEELEQRALVDALTGLPNRVALMGKLERAPSLADVTVLFIDLDGFKEVNDSLGHEQGDDVLREVAQSIASVVPSGIMVGRLGGDEFLALATGATSSAITRVCSRIIDSIEELGRARTRFPLSASIGLAVGTSSEPVEELLHRADQAMYRAKAIGPGRIVWYEQSGDVAPRALAARDTSR
jgi:diguanylate cyclase (GGDEF)-like protein/PAS domain S-box-containing protein